MPTGILEQLPSMARETFRGSYELSRTLHNTSSSPYKANHMAFRSTVYWKWMPQVVKRKCTCNIQTSPERQVYAGTSLDFGYLDLVEEGRKTLVKDDFTSGCMEHRG
ncbi:hypothetical protein NC653_029751 [Populus alba x Populus x berolinensis]|uniref:Uncharacterized protein n=1 Tax=Populus alba x Populus x berolinensis TaxID=444605 RepID=A0AAD6Q3R3_9ROSI|nr:hypothetical protein NC653_029751 [Populus alba x Populus x berolinensis]